jgi:hypothetical protein
MGRCRVVQPDVVRVQISDGDYLDVKKTLNAGEYRDLIAGMAGVSHFGEKATVDMKKVGITKVLQYLVGWSLVGVDNKPLPYDIDLPEEARVSALRSLDRETFSEIVEAIDAHESKTETERKNVPAGAKESPAISTSAEK